MDYENRPPLKIPLDDGKVAIIPLGITHDDVSCIEQTIKLWINKLVPPPKKEPENNYQI
jgi:hypothetical protein